MDHESFETALSVVKSQIFAAIGQNNKEIKILLRFFDHIEEANKYFSQLSKPTQQLVGTLLLGLLNQNGLHVDWRPAQ